MAENQRLPDFGASRLKVHPIAIDLLAPKTSSITLLDYRSAFSHAVALDWDLRISTDYQ